jgi:hypothetical protein
MNQSRLFTPTISHLSPYIGRPENSLEWIGIDETGSKYAIRTIEDKKFKNAPATEFFCYSLCRMTGIATPDYEIVQIQERDNQLAFGSKWLDGDNIFIAADQSEQTSKKLNELIVKSLLDINSIFTTDCILPNYDRHFGNFIFRQNSANTYSAIAYDWSQVEALSTSFSDYDLQYRQNRTITNIVNFKQKDLIKKDRVEQQINRILSVSQLKINNIFNVMPQEWKNNIDVDGIIYWWETMLESRINQATSILL